MPHDQPLPDSNPQELKPPLPQPPNPPNDSFASQRRSYSDSDADDDERDTYIWEKPRWADSKPAAWLARVLKAPAKIPRRVQRYLVIYITLVIATWFVWKTLVRPEWIIRKEINWSFNPNNKEVFGLNMMPEFADLVKVKKLDSALLPAAEQKKRMVVVGDVHGCREELVELLDKIKFRTATDHLVFTGDLVAKGPDSVGVVRLARQLSASCVRGNHEDRMLLALKAMEDEQLALDERKKNGQQHLDIEEASLGDERARHLAKQFKKDEIEWLKQCPVMLHVGPIPGMGDVVVVHAGIAPGVELDRQDPFLAMNMRTIDRKTRLPSEEREGTCWTKVSIYEHNCCSKCTNRKCRRGIFSRNLFPEKHAQQSYTAMILHVALAFIRTRKASIRAASRVAS